MPQKDAFAYLPRRLPLSAGSDGGSYRAPNARRRFSVQQCWRRMVVRWPPHMHPSSARARPFALLLHQRHQRQHRQQTFPDARPEPVLVKMIIFSIQTHRTRDRMRFCRTAAGRFSVAEKLPYELWPRDLLTPICETRQSLSLSLFACSSYVCPEPVLVKSSFLSIKMHHLSPFACSSYVCPEPVLVKLSFLHIKA